ncbi:MAG: FecR domain-containing protein [Lachnospiraceae bacterium]|nr:FecR domain-containing protein [Lachnospiraceae bacterium]
MLKSMPLIGKIIAAVCAVAVVGVGAVVIINLTKKDDSYRTIKVHEVEGTAEVERDATGKIDAYVNMQLQNEDRATTAEKSYLQLKLDDDKYIMLDPATKIKLEATGTKQDSKTKIELMEGAIVNRIENKLSENSSYEVNLPNATMAVRGTIFRCEVFVNEKGEKLALLSVVEGKVELVLLDGPNGTPGTTVIISAGQEVLIAEDDQNVPYIVGDPVEPDLRDWSLKELEFVVEGINNRNANGGGDEGPNGGGDGNGGGSFISVDDLQGLIDELSLDEDFTPQGAAGRYMDVDVHQNAEETGEVVGEANETVNEEPADENPAEEPAEEPVDENPDNNEIQDNNDQQTDNNQTADNNDNGQIADDDNADDGDDSQVTDDTDNNKDNNKDKTDNNKDKETDKDKDQQTDDQQENTDDQTDDNNNDNTGDNNTTGDNNSSTTDPNGINNNNNNSGTTSDDRTVVCVFPSGMTASQTVTAGPSVTLGDFPSLSGSPAGDWFWEDNETPAHTDDLVLDHVEGSSGNYIARIHWVQ